MTVLAARPISRPEPASAYTTIFYNGAGRTAPHIGLIGDSTLAATRWYGMLGALTRYNFVLDAESCRRTTHTSCRGREGYAPENTLTVMRRLEGRWGRVLVLMTGYDDPGSTVRRRHRRGHARGDPPGHPPRDVADVPHG